MFFGKKPINGDISMNLASPPPPISQRKTPNPDGGSAVADVLRFAIITLAIFIPIRLFVAQPFIVSGQSMEPTFDNGDYLIVDEISYRFESPSRGDVVVFRSPDNPKIFLIKRIIGLPNETVIIENDKVMIQNENNREGFYLSDPIKLVGTGAFGTLTYPIGDQEYFVMGDNRGASSDS